MANLRQDKMAIFIVTVFEALSRGGWDEFRKNLANHLNLWMLASIIGGLLTTCFNLCKPIS